MKAKSLKLPESFVAKLVNLPGELPQKLQSSFNGTVFLIKCFKPQIYNLRFCKPEMFRYICPALKIGLKGLEE
jgi:hypothetical protein